MDNWASFCNGLMISKKLIAVAALSGAVRMLGLRVRIPQAGGVGGGGRGMDVCLL